MQNYKDNLNEKRLSIYNPQNEELQKSYLLKGAKVNFLLLPTTYTCLTYMVFISRFRAIYELLTPFEKIKYISINGARVCIMGSLISLPLFLHMNDKILMTYKFNY